MKLHGTMHINDKGHLEIGGCDTVDLANEFGTPLIVYDEDYIRQMCRRFRKAFINGLNGRGDVAYAAKAFLTLAVASMIMEEGLSMDVVSGGELFTALKAGFPPERIYFHGNNKNKEELELAVKSGVGRIIVDNYYELDLLEEITSKEKKSISIMLRLTPGIEAHTHEYIKTGQEDSKFGFTLSKDIAFNAVKRVLSIPNVTLKGFHCHIGSQIFETEPFKIAAEILMEFRKRVEEELDYEVEELNLGGGFGIYYSEGDRPLEIEKYADTIKEAVYKKAEEYGLSIPKIIVEPGRSVVGPAGTTLYTVGSIKEIPGIRKYVSVDGGMADNIRPALYKAKYEAVVANKVNWELDQVVSIAGKCCESGDMLIWDIKLPKVEPGDILAVFCTGAYGYSMASNYNKLGRPAVVIVKEGRADLIVKRETYEDLIRNEVVPDRLFK
ncbi:MAG: Diaminopimelate decarboxylase [Clostridia bacterium 41_269]|nr:MAG: Diaminopimelate decarboxylase [Clostridia bacterium 41_269]